MLILNCGGTLNKRFNIKTDKMEIFSDNKALEKILVDKNFNYKIEGICYKESLDITVSDKNLLVEKIENSKEKTIIIIHGLTTIRETANFLKTKKFDKKIIILMGTKQPFEIDKIESSFNLGLIIGYTRTNPKTGIYICLNSEIIKIKKEQII